MATTQECSGPYLNLLNGNKDRKNLIQPFDINNVKEYNNKNNSKNKQFFSNKQINFDLSSTNSGKNNFLLFF